MILSKSIKYSKTLNEVIKEARNSIRVESWHNPVIKEKQHGT
jgi:hypothetical protein